MEYVDDAVLAIHLQQVAGFNLLSDILDSEDGRDAVFPRDDGAVGKDAARLGDEPRDLGEIHGPTRIGELGDQNVALLDLVCIVHGFDHDGPTDGTSMGTGDALQGVAVPIGAFSNLGSNVGLPDFAWVLEVAEGTEEFLVLGNQGVVLAGVFRLYKVDEFPVGEEMDIIGIIKEFSLQHLG